MCSDVVESVILKVLHLGARSMTAIHPRISERHPELRERDVLCAWENYSVGATRVPGERELRLGVDPQGRELEMVGVLTVDGWLVYHAMTPPSNKTRQEVQRAARRSL
jgi:hypothetical protein